MDIKLEECMIKHEMLRRAVEVSTRAIQSLDDLDPQHPTLAFLKDLSNEAVKKLTEKIKAL